MVVKSFSKSFENFKLSVSDLSFNEGKIVALVGANGCGKSTFAKCLSGIIKADSILETDIKSIGYMSQHSFPFRMSVRKNISLASNDMQRVNALIEKLGLDGIAEKNAKSLSGGQTARMALARALATDFDFLILDEPCASMDMQSTLASEECIREYVKGGNSILLITHSLQQARRIADEMIYMDNGCIVERGNTNELLENPKEVRTKNFFEFYGI